MQYVAPLAQAVLRVLARQWPDPATLWSGILPLSSGSVTDRDFVSAIQCLNDHGFIVYDALIVGADPDPAPRVIGAFITRKGQHLLGLINQIDG